ncbi:hypothetical protein [Micromonospora andamanensis]|uniref:hypothetical protein n=1 Tax=Micromonospora andamanensis TaxID=1287068 RepID=UPI00194F52A1|nr:hypothetical protein [Micromonospora andamanensis]GIJ41152.1 hypothetical protein Vwe01_44770 [Micromonospora andamanensis]
MSDPSATPRDVVELRVHGVSGAEAERMLDQRLVLQVAGDRSGGFYRPRAADPDVAEDPETQEAYRWSELPSGTAARTLSLVFLLPFLLCNVAIWMRPTAPGTGAGVRALCRVLALSLTLLFVVSVSGVALDLVAWRCMARPDCLAGRAWLSWLGGRPAGLRLAVSALVPMAAIGLVWWLAGLAGRPYAVLGAAAPVDAVPRPRLAAVGQWDSGPMVGRLRSIHVAAAFAALNAILLTARAAAAASPVIVVLATATGMMLLACVALLCAPPVIDRPAPHRRMDGAIRALPKISWCLTVLVLTFVLLSPDPWAATTALPGYGATVAWVLSAQTAILVALGVVALMRRRGDRRPGEPLRGVGAPVIAAVATGLAVAFASDLVHQSADLLDRHASAAERLATSPPLTYTWAIVGFFLAVVAAVIVAGLTILASRRARNREARTIVQRDYPNAPPDAAPRLDQVRTAIAKARFTERLEPLTLAYAVLFALGLATSTLGLLQLHPGEVLDRYTVIPVGLVTFLVTMGSYAVAALFLGLVIGGIFAYRTPEFRRYVGVLWDLGTFWPRAAHPFAPPSYAERAVPELSRRITYLVESGQAVLLTGHSHGSVLLAVTVLQLPGRISQRVALLTYGSPLRRLHTHLFPAYVDQAVLHEVGQRLDWRWLNLWRDTDPIGSWIFSPHRAGEQPTVAGPAGAVDRRLRDPSDVVVPPGDSVPPPVMGHGPDESDERFREAVRELTRRLRAHA